MNLSSTPEISIYELTQGEIQSPLPFKVTQVMLNSLLSSVIALLKEHSLKTTLWVKPLAALSGTTEIEDYFSHPCVEKIYWCNTCTLEPSLSSNKILPLELEASSKLKHEFFLIILSPEFCTAIVSQNDSNHRLKAELDLVITFEESIIKKILQGIKQIITITDKTPSEILTESEFNFAFPFSKNTNILGNLLVQQLIISADREVETHTSNNTNTHLISSNDFLNTLVRELLPSVTNMKTALRLLEAKQTPERKKRYMDLLQSECDRQSALITRFQELVELDQLRPEELEMKQSLEDLVAGIISTYQPLAKEKGIQLGYTVPAGFSSVSCPAPWLRQIIINLVNNSLKFTPSGGKVNVQALKLENQICITVSDTGIGVPQSDQQKIFNSFFRGKNPTNDVEPGAGLGLTLVKEILQRCGGEISLTSNVGKGSVFKVLIPIDNN